VYAAADEVSDVVTMVPSGPDRWSGTIYNADDGRVYRAHQPIKDGRMLVVPFAARPRRAR
jgi:uncharacterized protein (DUF2147 family)